MTDPITDPGPFSQARQEHEARRSYFLPAAFSRVEAEQPVHVIGSRGAGKTTFLMALCASERLENHSLQRQLQERDGELFAGRYVGVYMKLPKSQMYVFDRWIPDTSDELQMYSDLVGLYIGLNWSELMVKAVAELIDADVFQIEPEAEAAAVEKLCNYYDDPAFATYLNPARIRTLRGAERGFQTLRRQLQKRAQAKRPIEAVVDEFPIDRLATLAQFVAETLVALLPQDGKPWSFRVCLDEAESMTPRQIIVMNSIVRTSAWPLYPVVAWVSLSSWANTTDNENLTIGRADVEDVPLDQMKDSEFRGFVEGVTTVRVRDALGDSVPDVSLSAMLGPLDVNGLLEQIISRSASPWGRRLLAEAQASASEPFFKDARHTSPPIYQTYLVQTLGLEVPNPSAESWERRKQHSAEIRKKIVAAYMAICQELGTEPWYSSADMVIQLSDGCIRDFLWQLNALWTVQATTLERFVRTRIPDDRQDRALKAASAQKMARIGGLVLTAPRQAERLVDGLARLTSALQRPTKRVSDARLEHLKSPEPGYWVLPAISGTPSFLPASDRDELPWSYRLVLDAADAGYLRLESKDSAPWRFRVHTALAAHYGFSYRGAQYEVRVTEADIATLCDAATENERRKVVSDLYRRLRSTDQTLFEGSDV